MQNEEVTKVVTEELSVLLNVPKEKLGKWIKLVAQDLSKYKSGEISNELRAQLRVLNFMKTGRTSDFKLDEVLILVLTIASKLVL